MSRRGWWAGVALAGLMVVALWSSTLILGAPMRQANPTEQQQTVNAIVQGRFQQTAVVQQQLGATQTIDAAFNQALTATAGFNATVNAAFAQAATGTAGVPLTQIATTGAVFLATNAIDPDIHTTASGLQYKIEIQGTGPKPGPTDTVTVNYRGTLIDGTVFDSSYDRGQPSTFVLNQVIPGWTEGVQLMPVGSKYIFYIPPDLAYGTTGAGDQIPPNATLIFEIELLAIPSMSPAIETTPVVSATQGNLVIFNIVSNQSEVRFIINEVLRGSPDQVTGRTNQVAGQIGVDFASPQNSQVGEIRIDARSLATDNELRDRAIRGQILQSAQDQYEFISFKPTSIEGLPMSITMGQPVQFQITGDLTIRDITRSVTFNVTVTPDSETKIEGTASGTVQRDDFNLQIPNVPGVADVDETVQLQISFVATVGEE